MTSPAVTAENSKESKSMSLPTNPKRLWPALLLSACLPAAWAEDRALLISIADYQVPEFSLQGPRNDANTFKALLRDKLMFKDGQIKILQDGEATKAGILAAIDDWLVQGTAKGDRVVLYYSGHGEQMPDDNGDESDGKDEAILPYDTAANTDDRENWVRDDEISQRVARLKGREVLAVFDSCHSGTVTRGLFEYDDAKRPRWSEAGGTRSAPTPSLDRVHQQEGGFIDGGGDTLAFFAVAPNQDAIDDKTEPVHSVFTDALARGARGEADYNGDRQISYAELLAFTRSRANEYCKAHQGSKACSTNPTPQFAVDDSRLIADFLAFGQPAITLAAASPATVTDTLVHAGGAALGLTMFVEGKPLQDGDTVKLKKTVSYRFTTHKDGKLVLFDINAKGKISQLYPNRYMADDPHNLAVVYAGRPLDIPAEMKFTLRASGETGPGKIVAVLVEDKDIKTDDLIRLSEGNFRVIENPTEWLGQLSARLNQIFHEPDGKNRAIAWSMTSVNYTIVP